MKKLAITVWLAATLAGCAHTARPDLDDAAKRAQPGAGLANLYVYRPRGLLGIAVQLDVYVDERWAGALAAGTFARVQVTPGEHQVRVHIHGRAETTVLAEAGRSYYLKAAPALLSGETIEVITDEHAAQEDIRGYELVTAPPAQALRKLASDISRLFMDRIEPEKLEAEAAKALKKLDAAAPAGASDDLDSTIAHLLVTAPGLGNDQLFRVGAQAMVATVQPPPLDGRRVVASCGLVVGPQGAGTAIVAVTPDSPAAKLRVESGVEIREIDGKSARDRSPDEVAALLAGDPETEVSLVVGRPGEPDRKLVMRRAAPDLGATDCRILDGRVLFLHPRQVRPAVARRVRDLGRAALGSPAERVVLDLRDARGGDVEGIVELADSFLAEGEVLTVAKHRIANADKTYTAVPGTSPLEQARLVVLVNEHTAGPAEAVAAALQDHRRATVLGAKTAGRARLVGFYSVTNVAIEIPVARLVRPGGRPLDGIGVTPDDLGGSPAPDIREPLRDVSCPGVASPGPVSGDENVRRAVRLLLAAGPGTAVQPSPRSPK